MSNIEDQLLTKIKQGLLYRTDDGEIHYFHSSHRRFKIKIADKHPLSGRWRFRFGNERSTVYRNRLVWLITHRRSIPDDYVIDHKDGNCINDSPENLRLMHRNDSDRQGVGTQQDTMMDQLIRWFGFVGQWGREPQFSSEITWVEMGF